MGSPSATAAARWNRSLRCFRFQFAHGGHANDMDTLSATLRFQGGEAGLRDLFARLGLTLIEIPPDMPRRQVGVSYNSADWKRYADPITAYPAFASPGFVRLLDMPAHLQVAATEATLSLSGAHGDIWTIDETDFRHALALEALLPERGVDLCARTPVEELERQIAALLAAGPGATGTQEAAQELRALRAAAAANGAKANLLAYRFPGYTMPFLERICAAIAPDQ